VEKENVIKTLIVICLEQKLTSSNGIIYVCVCRSNDIIKAIICRKLSRNPLFLDGGFEMPPI
jgi:hypothetical protein